MPYYPHEFVDHGIKPHPARSVIIGRMPLAAVAKRLGVHTSTVCRILLGRTKPNKVTEHRLQELVNELRDR